MKNNILAILAAPAAIPPKPKMAAIIANMIKVIVQRNIIYCFGFKYFGLSKILRC